MNIKKGLENKNYNLLLMTGTISPSKSILEKGYNKEIDINSRLKQYISNIIYYLSLDNIDGIVFIDSSNYNLNLIEFESIRILSIFLGKDLELLSFSQDINMLNKYNYGYGEFQILEYFYDNSELLKKSNNFYKITGRYKVYNIKQIIDRTVNYDNLFYKFNILDFDTIATSFFKLNKESLSYISKNYQNNFLKYSQENYKYIGAENIFFEMLYKKYKLNSIRIYPYFHYLSKNIYLLYNILLKIGILDINNFFIRMITKIYSFLDVDNKIKYLKFIGYISKKIWSVKTK